MIMHFNSGAFNFQMTSIKLGQKQPNIFVVVYFTFSFSLGTETVTRFITNLSLVNTSNNRRKRNYFDFTLTTEIEEKRPEKYKLLSSISSKKG